jgi:hypothetical protein
MVSSASVLTRAIVLRETNVGKGLVRPGVLSFLLLLFRTEHEKRRDLLVDAV